MFICNHCPYVKHIRDELGRFGPRLREPRARDRRDQLRTTSAAYPDDRPEDGGGGESGELHVFPYLYDETQAVAKACRAACTPDFFLCGRDRSSSIAVSSTAVGPGNGTPVTGRDLRDAVDAVLSGRAVGATDQRPSLGCNIKVEVRQRPGLCLTRSPSGAEAADVRGVRRRRVRGASGAAGEAQLVDRLRARGQHVLARRRGQTATSSGICS